MRTVPINLILPTDKMLFGTDASPAEKSFKTLYLLHGIFGNYTDWVCGTRIQSWAQDRNLAVVMPSGDNSFYVDNRRSHALYGTFIGKELVDFTRRSFPLSRNREDTFIGGLSMGGYGSIVNALQNPDTFGAVCALSSATIIGGELQLKENSDSLLNSKGYFESVFGDLDKVRGSEKDYDFLAEKVAKSGTMPKFYMACGTEDGLFESNVQFKDRLVSLGYDVTWEQGPGGHDWYFWDKYILKAMEWLPLGDAVQGVGSGHVSE